MPQLRAIHEEGQRVRRPFDCKRMLSDREIAGICPGSVSGGGSKKAPVGLVGNLPERFQHIEFCIAVLVDRQKPKSRPCSDCTRQRGRHLKIAVGLNKAIFAGDHSRREQSATNIRGVGGRQRLCGDDKLPILYRERI